jgi:uncharacterized protein YoxC
MKLSQSIGVLATALLFLAIYLVFSYAPIEKTMLEVQKIFSIFTFLPRSRYSLLLA